MPTLKGLQKTGHPGVFSKKHPTRKHGINFDQKWIIRQTLGGVTRVSALGWQSEKVKLGDALNKAAEFRSNFKWNKQNPDLEPKPICSADEKKIADAKKEAIEKARTQAETKRAIEKNSTFASLWKDYKNHLIEENRGVASDTSRFEKHLRPIHNKRPDNLSSDDIDLIKKELRKKKLSDQTIKHCLTLIERIVNHGLSQIPARCKPLMLKIKKPSFDNKVTEFLTDEELQALLEAINDDLERDPFTGRAMLLALSTGMRRGALLRLKWDDLDFTFNNIFLKTAKAKQKNKTYIIPLNEGAKRVLNNIPKIGSPYVFPGQKDADGKWKQRSDFNRGSRRIREAAGLPKDFRPFHGLRHHFASALISDENNVVDIYVLQKLLTHQDIKTTERYASIADKRLKDASAAANSLTQRKILPFSKQKQDATG